MLVFTDRLTAIRIAVLVSAMSVSLAAQWLDHPDPRTPRTRDGKPNLTAPAPRVNGKPDLSGIWEVIGSPGKVLEPYLLPGGEKGFGKGDPALHFINIVADYPFGQEPFQPAAAAMFRQQMQSG